MKTYIYIFVNIMLHFRILLCCVEHRGEILEKAVKESGISITVLAKKLNKSRQYVYNLFLNSYVNPDVVLEIGKIIHHDFSKEINIFKVQDSESIIGKVSNEEAQYWKNKYIELLEKYNTLLESKI